MIANSILRRAGIVVGIAVFLFVLLIFGGWAFLCGIGALFALGYRRSTNRGYLIAASTFIGLGIGVGIELALSREGGVAILIGLGLGLFGMAIVIWLEAHQIQWWSLLLSIACLGLTVLLWSFTMDDLQVFLSIFPFCILALLIFAAYEYWQNRKTLKNQVYSGHQ